MYTAAPLVRYRQHGKYLVGTNASFYDRLQRMGMLFQGTFRSLNEWSLQGLETFLTSIPLNNRSTLKLFAQCHQASFGELLSLLLQSGVYRQTRSGAAELLLAVLFRRM